jgi:predicted DNA-binding transcriptional regulator YafY
MRFEDAYGDWQSSRLTQEEAARLLGVYERTFRRYIDRYEDAGLEGLIDKRLSQVSHRRAPVDEMMELVERYIDGTLAYFMTLAYWRGTMPTDRSWIKSGRPLHKSAS